jgi:hypothetical protein
MWVTLNDAEQKLAKYIAAQRHNNNRKQNVKNARIGPQTDEQTDLNGIAAEIVWCKVNNCYPDMDTNMERPYADAVTHTGELIDIKTTTYTNGHLLAVPWKTGEGVDVYCLIIGEFPKYRIAGYMDANVLIDKNRLKCVGKIASYAATQQELSKEY